MPSPNAAGPLYATFTLPLHPPWLASSPGVIREREAAESLPRIPIVFESGDVLAPQVRRADADPILAQPFTAQQLVEAVIEAGWPRTPGSVGW